MYLEYLNGKIKKKSFNIKKIYLIFLNLNNNHRLKNEKNNEIIPIFYIIIFTNNFKNLKIDLK